MHQEAITSFRGVCEQAGLPVTHQRQVIYEALIASTGHPSPEEVHAIVRERVPSISLATVYRNLHLFINAGILRQVSLHHGSMRVETNHAAHHHAVCTRCKSITDVDASLLVPAAGQARLPGNFPADFLVQRIAVDILGLCSDCQSEQAAQPATQLQPV